MNTARPLLRPQAQLLIEQVQIRLLAPRERVRIAALMCQKHYLKSARLVGGRRNWGIEKGLHQRLDVSLGEDRSRVRHRTSALNLAMMRRAVVSVAVCWMRKSRNPRKATRSGFCEHLAAHQLHRAFSLVTARHSSALSTSRISHTRTLATRLCL